MIDGGFVIVPAALAGARNRFEDTVRGWAERRECQDVALRTSPPIGLLGAEFQVVVVEPWGLAGKDALFARDLSLRTRAVVSLRAPAAMSRATSVSRATSSS